MSLPALVEYRETIDRHLDRALPAEEGPAARVNAAMRHAVLAGGKRLRPAIVFAGTAACGGDPRTVVEPAAALELLHTYSLVHDDLPAMDDDDYRRGRPTVHRAFGEAVAILAGDALHTLCFEWLATFPAGDAMAARRAEACALVARAAGVAGMVGGQVADLEAEGEAVDEARLGWIHRHKTASLFAASAELGAVLCAADASARDALRNFGQSLGLAFQITDDILDRTGSATELGKTPGKDDRSGKATYPALIGLDASRRRARELMAVAVEGLRQAGLRSDTLEELARVSVDRKR